MSGHSKWHSIKHKKGAEDKKRGKIFTKHAKLIAIAARGGGDPDMNPSLRMALENARAENMPRENMDRAIKKGTGEGKDAVQMEEIFYEGYGPGGVALYIETLTDNRNRTVTNLKTIISKKGGNLGAAGSVAYLFKKRGVIAVPAYEQDLEKIELAAIDAGAEDVQVEDLFTEEDQENQQPISKNILIMTDPHDLMKVKNQLITGGIKVESARMTYVPQTMVAIEDETTAKNILDLIEAIEEDEDVNEVFTNIEK